MAEYRKNDRIRLRIEDLSDTGEGIGKLDGFTWFVKDAIIGDRVEALVMKVKKTYGFARLMEVLEPSPHRITPRCPVARSCGGCQLQAMSYEEQLRYKENKVWNNLRRIGGLRGLGAAGAETADSCAGGDASSCLCAAGTGTGGRGAILYPIVGMDNPWRYRNKAQFPFGKNKEGKTITGFYAGRTHSIIESEECYLGVPENRVILACIRRHMGEYGIQPYDETGHTGLVRHVLIRKGFRTGELLVCLVINGKVEELKGKDKLVEKLAGLRFDAMAEEQRADKPAGPESRVTSISCSINRDRTNVILGKELVNLYGPGYITDFIGSIRYQISPLSFYQVNPVQTERLYGTALEYAGLTGRETVWDLYCGIGTISLFLAQKAQQVYGVEIVPQAIEDARRNAALNGITNAEFFLGKAEEVLPEQYQKNHIHADVIVVDPPRKGCDPVCLDTIIQMAPQRVVYVSCDSATLARDLKILCENGFAVEKVQPVDMFPWSGHVETVCLLSKLNVKQHIEVELTMDEMDLTAAEKKASYEEIKEYVLEKFGMKVSHLYIAQVKRKCGIIERENYNKPKLENAKQPQCPPEKEAAIRAALEYFKMIK